MNAYKKQRERSKHLREVLPQALYFAYLDSVKSMEQMENIVGSYGHLKTAYDALREKQEKSKAEISALKKEIRTLKRRKK